MTRPLSVADDNALRGKTGYAAYLRVSKKRQRTYICREQERMIEASRLSRLYGAAMARLELHPLTADEIVDRQRELESMAERVEATHGDNESQRAWYETMEAKATKAKRSKRSGR